MDSVSSSELVINALHLKQNLARACMHAHDHDQWERQERVRPCAGGGSAWGEVNRGKGEETYVKL